jgi:hypothetical protein
MCKIKKTLFFNQIPSYIVRKSAQRLNFSSKSIETLYSIGFQCFYRSPLLRNKNCRFVLNPLGLGLTAVSFLQKKEKKIIGIKNNLYLLK